MRLKSREEQQGSCAKARMVITTRIVVCSILDVIAKAALPQNIYLCKFLEVEERA